jgi:predicted ATPase
MIDQIADRGFCTAPESGRAYIEGEFAKGRTIEEIREDPAAMTRKVYNLMIKREMELRVDETTFLDRGLPDAPAFYRIAGMDPNLVVPDCFIYRYASVFMLDRLPYQIDGVRVADDPTAEYYDAWIEHDYHTIGYEIVRVPVLPPEERLSYVLEMLSEL